MIRHCIIDLQKNEVTNVIDYDEVISGTPPGMTEDFLAVASDTAQIGWLWAGQELHPPKSNEPHAEAAARVWGSIKLERDRRKAGGVKVGEKWFHSDDGSRIQLMGLVMMGASLPANLQWKTMDGSFITMTPALAQQVFTGQAASDQTIFAVAEAHRLAMQASADPAAYDYSTGWPKVFGEA